LKRWEGCENIVIVNSARYQGFEVKLIPVWYFEFEAKIRWLEGKWSDTWEGERREVLNHTD